MMIRHKPGVLSKLNSDLAYFANAHITANMEELTDAGQRLFFEELETSVILMTPSELNRLLDEARRQGKYL